MIFVGLVSPVTLSATGALQKTLAGMMCPAVGYPEAGERMLRGKAAGIIQPRDL